MRLTIVLFISLIVIVCYTHSSKARKYRPAANPRPHGEPSEPNSPRTPKSPKSTSRKPRKRGTATSRPSEPNSPRTPKSPKSTSRKPRKRGTATSRPSEPNSPRTPKSPKSTSRKPRKRGTPTSKTPRKRGSPKTPIPLPPMPEPEPEPELPYSIGPCLIAKCASLCSFMKRTSNCQKCFNTLASPDYLCYSRPYHQCVELGYCEALSNNARHSYALCELCSYQCHPEEKRKNASRICGDIKSYY